MSSPPAENERHRAPTGRRGDACVARRPGGLLPLAVAVVLAFLAATAELRGEGRSLRFERLSISLKLCRFG